MLAKVAAAQVTTRPQTLTSTASTQFTLPCQNIHLTGVSPFHLVRAALHLATDLPLNLLRGLPLNLLRGLPLMDRRALLLV